MSSMTTPDIQERDPAAIEADIARRRASLDRKLEEIEQRLIRNPQQRLTEIRERVERIPFAAWGAVAAVAAGSWMALSGLRRSRARHDGNGADVELEQAVSELEQTLSELDAQPAAVTIVAVEERPIPGAADSDPEARTSGA